jgi:bacillolysin
MTSTGYRTLILLTAAAWLASASAAPRARAQRSGLARIAAGSIADIRAWDRQIDGMLDTGELRVRTRRDDTLIPGRVHERSDQFHRGVRVWGADASRQLAGGQTVSVFGVLYEGIAIDTAPALTAEQAKAAIETLAGVELGASRVPELVVLPLAGEGAPRYALSYTERAMSSRGLYLYFVDARTGRLLLELNDLKSQASAVGRGHGVLGDEKKISTRPDAGGFQTWDELRPPDIRTYDMKGNLARTLGFLNGTVVLSFSELAADGDNDWGDGAVVDAHVYTGWTYDYYFKRHNRQGLNNNNIRVVSLLHPVHRQDVFTQPPDVVGAFYANAFYAGGGILVYGEGFPPGVTLGGNTIDFLAGGIDIVAHELTHGVTDFTSNLIYQDESGALNEAFSDMMAAGVEFFFQPAGGGQRQADYLIAEDVWRPRGLRSMSDPASLGDPDHYSTRFTGPEDNGGVHINAGIPNQAFYLAIEGGTNRTSGLAVQGVGGANREQIERVFYRAFTQMLPAGANFSTARAATIQAARDLYGAGGAAERAVTQAWTAVGVN